MSEGDEDLVEMTNEALAEHLNRQFAEDGPRVTVDVIRQWVRWKVLPRSTGRGRTVGQSRSWARGVRELQQAGRLAELRVAGLTSMESLQTQMWLEGWPIEFDLARRAISVRFNAVVAKMRRPVTTNFDPESVDAPSPAKIRAVAHQMGRQADIFRQSTFRLDPDEAFRFFGPLFLGVDKGLDLGTIAGGIFSIVGQDIELPAAPNITRGMSGVLGDPDEIEDSGRTSISDASKSEYEVARRGFRLVRRVALLYSIVEFRKLFPTGWDPVFRGVDAVGDQVFIGDWAVLLFCAGLHALRATRENSERNLEVISAAESVVDMLEKSLPYQVIRDGNTP